MNRNHVCNRPYFNKGASVALRFIVVYIIGVVLATVLILFGLLGQSLGF